MAWGFGKSEKESTSSDNDKDVQYPQNYPGANDAGLEAATYDPGDVQCPPHTTERKLLTRIDLRVVPFLALLYWLAFLDRVNISNANVFGLSEDLGLQGTEYNTALVIFFVPILFEIPANILMKKFTPHVWLAANMILFGFVTIMQGLVKSYSGLLATRFFLGLFEAGMFPGCFYLIGMWYKRKEAQKRFSFFFSSTSLAGGFGGLIAAGIGKMDGMRGYENWRWVFIIEGGFTVACSLVVFFCLSDFPEEAKWLKPSEKAFVAARLRVDQGEAARNHKVSPKAIVRILSEFRVLIAGVMYFGLVVPAYSYAYFAPSIIQGFGYSQIQTQLHSVPPWAAAFGFAMLTATFSDMTRHRFAWIIGCLCVAISGFAILISVQDQTKVQYAALFLVAMGCYSAMPFMVCWFNMNIGGHVRRSVCSAWQVSFGNIGGIIAVFVFLPSEKPVYTTGYSVCIAFTCLAMVAGIMYGLSCIRENRKREKTPTNLNLSASEKAELGDLNPEYRYLL